MGSSSSGSSTARRQIVMQSSQQDTAGAAKSQTKEELQQALKNAIAAEDYITAARLKEQITEIEMQDPLTGLKWALEAAIEEERYAVSKPFVFLSRDRFTKTLVHTAPPTFN
jgi:hypothetical protein